MGSMWFLRQYHRESILDKGNIMCKAQGAETDFKNLGVGSCSDWAFALVCLLHQDVWVCFLNLNNIKSMCSRWEINLLVKKHSSFWVLFDVIFLYSSWKESSFLTPNLLPGSFYIVWCSSTVTRTIQKTQITGGKTHNTTGQIIMRAYPCVLPRL